MSFDLDQGQWAKFKAWKQEQDKSVAEKQKGGEHDRGGLPYYGCSGGAYTYSFTPTTLGLVTTAENSVTGEKIDLTDYDGW